jgi:lipopolysaccharide/colanic/teichoic acid biosynthesis glycosyltransferase
VLYLCVKRTFDFLIALLGLLVLSPLLLVLAVLIRLDSRGPSLFAQKRLAKGGRHFVMVKFRTMSVQAEQQVGGLFNFGNDARVTRIGRWLRKTSLDELPQLFNVLVGDMALGGPRPAVWYELGDFETLNALYKKRFRVRPGITGLAQVRGRNELPWPEKVRLDNDYVDALVKNGWKIDLSVLAATFFRVFAATDIDEPQPDGYKDTAEAAADAQQRVEDSAHERLPLPGKDFFVADRVSVVIPVFNASAYIAQTLQSVLAQTVLPHEVIVVDDGSTDETAAIVTSYSSPVVYLRLSENGGLPWLEIKDWRWPVASM